MKPRVRKLLFMLVLGLAAAPLVPLPAGAVLPPATRLLQAAVPGQGSHFVTSAVRAPGAFDVAGLTYDGPAGADVELRTSRDGRTWSAWADAGDRDAEGPDPASHETAQQATPRGTNPIWADGARYVQYRIASPAGPVRNLRLQAVDSQGHAERVVTRLHRHLRALLGHQVARPAMAMTDQPPIVTRAQWGADERIRRDPTPEYGRVQVAFVHHTVTPNDYSPSQAPSFIRGIYAYHVQSNGWDDIGYNFLVDRYGTIYEGRYGGIDRPVIGAHAQGFNSTSFGTALLGTFSGVSPPPAMLHAL